MNKNILKKIIPAHRIRRFLFSPILNRINEIDKKYEYLFWISNRRPDESLLETKQRIFMDMPKYYGTHLDLQRVNNYILQRIKRICDDNGIDYFLIWGTLIGAVRHHGMIPWDDDIDIGMMVEEYRRFETLANNDPEISSHMYYGWNRGKVIVKVKLKGYECFWVDICLFDCFEADETNKAERWKKIILANRKYQKKSIAVFKKYHGSKPQSPYHIYDPKIEKELAEIGRKYYANSILSVTAIGFPEVWSRIDASAAEYSTEMSFSRSRRMPSPLKVQNIPASINVRSSCKAIMVIYGLSPTICTPNTQMKHKDLRMSSGV